MKNIIRAAALASGFLLAGGIASLGACSASPSSEVDRNLLTQAAEAALSRFESSDSTLAEAIESAYAYAVFPESGKGGFVIGGGGGHGVVYRDGGQIGWCSFTTVTVGLQAGGQGYSMLILFKDQTAFDRFASGGLEGSATASAVAVKAGAAANADYENGVMVLTDNAAGLMAEATVGGQYFKYRALD